MKILEIGSGYGSFVEKMREEGYNIDGLELSEEKCRLLEKRTGITMKSYNILSDCDEMKQDENKYDVVCMHNVFEHISNPNTFLTRIKLLLKDNGTVYIEVPNRNGFLRELSKPYNDFGYLRGHLSYFTPETLIYTLDKNGFMDIQISGSQLYSLENALNWINNGVPVITHCQFDLPEGLEFAEEYFKSYLEERLLSESIIGIAKIRN